MVVELNDLIQVYDEVLDLDVCNYLINLFDQVEELHERIENEGVPNFTQFNLTENCKISEHVDSIHNYIIRKVIDYKKEYYEFIDDRCFPQENTYEQFRIKKYKVNNNDLFNTHVDVTDYSTSRRYLSYIFYLNDVEVGGETVFRDLEIKPKAGKLVMFPPMWMFPHKGNEPISNPKYILSAYLHYK